MKYTVLVPVYNESNSLTELCDRIETAFRSIKEEKEFDILIVDDGSTDSSRDVIKSLCAGRGYVKAIFLRKNVGKSFALTAGFMNSHSDYVITIDGDLQDRPEDIPVLINKISEGYDLVSGWKQNRKDGIVRVLGSRVFNDVVSRLGGIRFHDFNCGFKIYRSNVVKNISVYGQHHRFIPLLAYFMGFKVTEAPISHDKRRFGYSKYPAFRYHGLFDILSILFTYKYRFSPLYFFGAIGIMLIAPGALLAAYLLCRHLMFVFGFGTQYMLFNRPLLMASFTVCILGLNVFLTGFVCDFILQHSGSKGVTGYVESLIDGKEC